MLKRRVNWHKLEPYLFISPFMIGLIVFLIGPTIASLVLSFTRFEFIGSPEFIGFDNYAEMLFEDHKVGISLGNTVYYMAGHIPLGMAMAFFVALMLNQKVWGQALFRTMFYLPSVTASVATAVVWSWVFNSRFGLLNNFLGLFGIEGPQWLASTRFAMPSLILISLWGMGSTIIIFLAALQGVPQSLYESASIDGAGRLRRLRHITIPMMTPAIFFVLIVQIVGSFQVFTNAFIITAGGPGNSTLFYVLHLYNKAFVALRLGYASALAWLLFIIVLFFTITQVVVARRWVYYEGEMG